MGDVDEANEKFFEKEYLSWLNIAHKSVILLYTKNKSSLQKARQLRPEFSKIYVANEHKDLIRLLDKHASSADHNGIDVLIADVDHTTGKVLETMKKRSVGDDTKHLAQIPILLLMPNPIDEELKQMIDSTPIDNIRVNSACDASQLLRPILELLHRKCMVESVYADLRIRLKNAKYPYLSIFDDEDDVNDDLKNSSSANRPSECSDEEATEDVLETDPHPLLLPYQAGNGISEENAEAPSALILTSSPVVPVFVTKYRDKYGKVALKKKKLGTVNTNLSDPKYKSVVDHHILGVLQKREGYSTVVDDDKFSNQSLQTFMQKKGIHSDAPMIIRSRNREEEVLASPKAKHEKSTVYFRNGSNGFDDFDILDMSHRVQWKQRPASSKASSANADSKNFPPELTPFVKVAQTVPSKPHTIVGLSKKSSLACWKVLKLQNKFGPGYCERGHDRPWTTSNTKKRHGIDSLSLAHSISSQDSLSTATDGLKQLDSASKGSTESQANLALPKNSKAPTIVPPISEDDSQLVKPAVLNVIRTWRGVAETPTCDDSGTRVSSYNSLPQLLREAGGIAFGSILIGQKARVKARKLIRDMLLKVPDNPETSDVITFSMDNRRIGPGERELIVLGLHHQKVGMSSQAIKTFTRAIDVIRYAYIPLICRGIVYFQTGHYFSALHDFSEAIKVITNSKSRILDYKKDLVLAHYNKGLSQIKLGDDESGIDELKKAVELDPENAICRNTLILAFRRTSQYLDAIEHCIVLFDQQKERDLKEREEKAKQDIAQQTNKYVGTDYIKNSLSVSAQSTRASTAPAGSKSSGDTAGSGSGPTVGSSLERDSFRGRSPTRLQPHAKSGSPFLINSRGSSIFLKQYSSMSNYVDNLQEINRTVIRVNVKEHIFPGIKELKQIHEANNRKNGDKDDTSAALLERYKHANGIENDVYASLFVRLSSIQESLLTPPSLRNFDHLKEIAACLRTFPVLSAMIEPLLNDLASVIEYRTVATNTVIYQQNEGVNGVLLVMNGQLQLRMDTGQQTTTISTLQSSHMHGMLDTLFYKSSQLAHSPHNLFVQKLYKQCLTSSFGDLKLDHEEAEEAEEADENGDVDAANVEKSVPDLQGLNLEHAALPRALKPASFVSCRATKPTELMVIRHADFERFLRDAYEKDFYERLNLIRASGIFDKNHFTPFDQIRLVRMSVLKSFAQGSTILAQGEKPEFLYFVMKGLCKVKKSPDATENLILRLEKLKSAISAHDAKYVFHHKLRGEITLASEDYCRAQPSETYLTAAEESRDAMRLEVAKLEAQIIREKAEETKRLEEEEEKRRLGRPTENNSVDIATIKWPQIFGEACLLQRDSGGSLGTVIAETLCQVLCIHYLQLETFKIEDYILERVRLRAVVYPPDEQLLEMIRKTKEWKLYKEQIISQIPQDKWSGVKQSK